MAYILHLNMFGYPRMHQVNSLFIPDGPLASDDEQVCKTGKDAMGN